VGERKLITVGAIVRHEQPARQPLGHGVATIAGGGLRYLRVKGLHVQKQQ
jgi:hypothetical protein